MFLRLVNIADFQEGLFRRFYKASLLQSRRSIPETGCCILCKMIFCLLSRRPEFNRLYIFHMNEKLDCTAHKIVKSPCMFCRGLLFIFLEIVSKKQNNKEYNYYNLSLMYLSFAVQSHIKCIDIILLEDKAKYQTNPFRRSYKQLRFQNKRKIR